MLAWSSMEFLSVKRICHYDHDLTWLGLSIMADI